MVNIEGLEKSAVLKALYDSAKPITGAKCNFPNGIPLGFAKTVVQKQLTFVDLFGRNLLVSITDDQFNPWSYNVENGENAAEQAIQQLREQL